MRKKSLETSNIKQPKIETEKNIEFLKEEIKKSAIHAKDSYDYQKLCVKRNGLLSCHYEEDREDLYFYYTVKGMNPFIQVKSESREKKYQILINFSKLKELQADFLLKLTEENYVGIAEKAIREICAKKNKMGKPVPPVTTSKIRNLLAMTAAIYNDVIVWQSEKLSTEVVGRINYMKIRFVYEAGREPKVKELVEKAQILEHLEEIGNSRTQYILFSRYMEALVAYRKFYGGHDE